MAESHETPTQLDVVEAHLAVMTTDRDEWRAEAERNRAAYAEAMIRESRARERITELERLLHDAFRAGAAWATGDSRDFRQTHPDRKTWVRQALGGSDA